MRKLYINGAGLTWSGSGFIVAAVRGNTDRSESVTYSSTWSRSNFT